MRKLLLSLALLLAAQAPAWAGPIYAVIFEINLGEGGAIASMKVSGITAHEGDPLPKSIPDAFVAAARERLSQLYRGHSPGHFFTYVLFDPQQPTNASIDSAPKPAAEALGPSLTIERGERLAVKLPDSAGGEPVVVSRDRAPLGPASQLEDVNWQRFAIDGPVGESRVFAPRRLDLPKEPKAEPDLLRLTMKPGPKGNDTFLIVENGYRRMLRYRARMSRDGKPAEPTSVCDVVPGIVAFEYWSYPIDRLDLGRFELVDEPADRKIACR